MREQVVGRPSPFPGWLFETSPAVKCDLRASVIASMLLMVDCHSGTTILLVGTPLLHDSLDVGGNSYSTPYFSGQLGPAAALGRVMGLTIQRPMRLSLAIEDILAYAARSLLLGRPVSDNEDQTMISATD